MSMQTSSPTKSIRRFDHFDPEADMSADVERVGNWLETAADLAAAREGGGDLIAERDAHHVEQ